MASILEIPGQREIRRENLQRDVTVTARFENMNLGDGMAKVQKAIEELKLPPLQSTSDTNATFMREERIQRGDTVASLLSRLRVDDAPARPV